MPNFAYLQIIMTHNILYLALTYGFHAETNKNPHPASQLHADQTNNKLYLYEKQILLTNYYTMTTIKVTSESFYSITEDCLKRFTSNFF